MTAFRDRMIDTQRECDRLLGDRNARLRFDFRLSDAVDVGGVSQDDSWRVWVETSAGVVASGKGRNGSVAFDAMLKQLREKKS